ncbi:hypothetical protein QZM18_12405 [Burkholderia diffusa]|nr:hypothetical protein [Burkholderia diffusa]MDN7904910.1 hypothetical protein [Burkholderia diffusa]
MRERLKREEQETRAAARSESPIKTLWDIIHVQTVAMQSGIIEWQHGEGAEAGLNWIFNTLAGGRELQMQRLPLRIRPRPRGVLRAPVRRASRRRRSTACRAARPACGPAHRAHMALCMASDPRDSPAPCRIPPKSRPTYDDDTPANIKI